MKRIKLLLGVCMVLFFCADAKTQTYFEDSTKWFVHRHDPKAGHYYKDFIWFTEEVIRFDSFATNGEYYTVILFTYSRSKLSEKYIYQYQLRVYDDRVYFTGIITDQNDKKFEKRDLLIYDFNLKAGDTLDIVIDPGKFYYKLKCDSTFMEEFEDDMERMSHSYSVVRGDYYLKNVIITEGLGARSGLVFFPLNYSYYAQNIISICHKDELIYKWSVVDWKPYNEYVVENYCSRDDLKKFMNWARVKLYNPPMGMPKTRGYKYNGSKNSWEFK